MDERVESLYQLILETKKDIVYASKLNDKYGFKIPIDKIADQLFKYIMEHYQK